MNLGQILVENGGLWMEFEKFVKKWKDL